MGLWYESVYKGFLTACTIIFLLSFGFTGETQFNAMITGYSLMIISISLIMIVLIAKISSSSQNNSISSSILSALLNTGPFVIMLILACIIVYIQITYKTEIISGNISTGYNSFNNISLVLFITQIYILYNAMKTNKFQTSGHLPRVVSGLIYFIDIINALCAIIMFIILKYFTTDG